MPEHGLECKRRFEKAQRLRQNWTWLWQQVANLVLTSRQFTSSQVSGAKRNLQIHNDTAPLAAASLAAAMHGLQANEATRWYSLITEDFDQRIDVEVRKFLYNATSHGLSYLASPMSGFPTAISECYLDLVVFGTGIMSGTPDKENILRFNARQLANFFMCEDPNGVINETFRRYELTSREISKEFDKPDDDIPDEIKDHIRDGKNLDKKWTIIHEVSRRLKRNVTSAMPRNMPWMSIYILEKTGHLIRESGFRRNPYITPRWSKSPEEVFGRSPAIMMLPSIKMINQMSKTVITAAQIAVHPPMLVPANGMQGPVRLAPGSMTYTRTGTSQKPEPLITNVDPRIGQEMIDAVALQIERAFFLDALKLPELDRMTAEEVITRRQQGLLTASPVISRLNAELLSPIVLRTFHWQRTTRRLGPVPDGLSRARLKIDFRSPMAQSQKASEGGAVLTAIQSMTPILAVDPTSFGVVNADKVNRFLWESANAPPDLLNTEEEVAARRQQESEQQQLEQQVALAGGAAAAAKDAAAAGKDVAGR